MIYFKLNVSALKENISNFKTKLTSYNDEIERIYSSMKTVDDSWNDKSSKDFILCIDDDNKVINEYLNYLESVYKEIENFSDSIIAIFNKSNEYKNDFILTFNNENIKSAISKLNNALSDIKWCTYMLSDLFFPKTLSYYQIIYNLRTSIASIGNSVSSLIDDINYVNNKITNDLEEANKNMSKLEKVDINIEPIKYNWSVVDAKIVNAPEIIVDKYSASQKTLSEVEQEHNFNLSQGVNINSAVTRSISKLEEQKLGNLTNGTKEVSDNIKGGNVSDIGTKIEKDFSTNEVKAKEGSLEIGIKSDVNIASVEEVNVAANTSNIDSTIVSKSSEIPHVSQYDPNSTSISEDINSRNSVDNVKTFGSLSDIINNTEM